MISMWKVILSLALLQNSALRNARASDLTSHHNSMVRHLLDRPAAAPAQQRFCLRGNTRGSCVSGQQCGAWGGVELGHCRRGGEVCCVVKPRCNQETAAASVLFENSNYPMTNGGDSLCVLKLHTSPQTCAVRVDVDDFSLYSAGRSCTNDGLIILGTSENIKEEKAESPIWCGQLNQTTVSFEVPKRAEVTFAVTTQKPHKYSLKITQLECASIKRFKSPTNAGLLNVDAQEYITTPKSATTTRKPTNTTTETAATTVRSSEASPEQNTVEQRDEFFDVFEDLPEESYFRKVLNAGLWSQRQGDVPWDQRIIGGQNANLHEYPWQVSLVSKARMRHFCGGSLITERIVLTAGHCLGNPFMGSRLSQVLVSVGDHDILNATEAESKFHSIKRVYLNLHYNLIFPINDIAMLELEEPVQFGYNVAPVRLPQSEEWQYVGENATISGWGRVSFEDNKAAPILKEVHGLVLSDEECKERYHGAIPPQWNLKIIEARHHICIDVSAGRTCNGDSGGPMVVCSGRVCTQVGAVSFGFPGCRRGVPTVMARVGSYLPWIDMSLSPLNEEEV